MLKQKLKFFLATFAALTMILTCSVSFAANAEDVNSTQDKIAEGAEEHSDDVEASYKNEDEYGNENTIESDLYLIQDEVNINQTVDGNVFIIAKTVNIKSQISGDAFIIANTVNIDGGYVYNNLFVLANSLNVDGIIYDLYACADTITIGENGYVYRDVHSISDTFNIWGSIRRNVIAGFNKISFMSEGNATTGSIYGNLEYYSTNEIPNDKISVEGDVTFNKQESGTSGKTIITYLTNAATYVATAVIIYLLILWLAPKFRESSKEMLKNKLLPIIGFGLLGLFAVPVISLILVMLGITSKVALAILALYASLLFIASAAFIVGLTEVIAEKIKVDNKWKVLGLVAVAAVAIWAIELIPFLGLFISFATAVLGLGLIIKYALPVKKEKENN